MIKIHLFYKLYEPAQWQVAHLYQRLFIKWVRSQLRSKDLPSDLVGYIGGETFWYHVLELEAQFYTPEASDIFLSLVHNREPNFSTSEIQDEIRGLECEDYTKIEYNLEAVKKQLASIREKPWQPISDLDAYDFIQSAPKQASAIKMSPNFRPFQNIRVDIELPAKSYGADKTHLFIMIRFWVIITDSISQQLEDTLYIYNRDSYIRRFNRFFRARLFLNGRRSITQKQIEKQIESALSRLKDPSSFLFIRNHLIQWAHDKRLQIKTGLDYFRYNDVLIGGKGMEKIVSQERINDIIDNLRIKIKLIKPSPKYLAEWEAKQESSKNELL